VSDVARRHDINPSQLFGWVKQFHAAAMAMTSVPVTRIGRCSRRRLSTLGLPCV
jgi:transposase-like protein